MTCLNIKLNYPAPERQRLDAGCDNSYDFSGLQVTLQCLREDFALKLTARQQRHGWSSIFSRSGERESF
jgi:hypothetical protein